MGNTKYKVVVFTYNGKGVSESDCYYMTEQEIYDRCCIYECSIYFYDSIPEYRKNDIDIEHVTINDIENYWV